MFFSGCISPLKFDYLHLKAVYPLTNHATICSYFYEQISRTSIQNRIAAIVGIDIHFLRCVNDYSYRTNLFWAAVVIVAAISIVKFIIGMTASPNHNHYDYIIVYI
jgi:hypothetical protein